MKELVFLLEEESAKAMLQGLLPRLLPDGFNVRFIVFEGKQDLENQLKRRLWGYRNPEARFLVMRDQDNHPDCTAVKARLSDLVREAGHQGTTLVRIACRELESFYLADLAAVEQGLGIVKLARQQAKASFRAPDALGSPSRELCALTRGAYQKVGGSRAIGPFLDLDNVRSPSFRNLVSGIRRLVA